jgi:hypothetical protein
MEAIKIKNDAGLELTVTTVHPENYNPIIGGMSTSPSWEEYLSGYNDEYQAAFRTCQKSY